MPIHYVDAEEPDRSPVAPKNTDLQMLIAHQDDILSRIDSIDLAMEIEPNRDQQYRADRLLQEAKKQVLMSKRLVSKGLAAARDGNDQAAAAFARQANVALVNAAIAKDRARATLQREVLA